MLSALALAVGALAVTASPVHKRQAATIDDPTILNFALTLEHLEDTFYQEGLKNFSASDFEAAGFPSWVRDRITEIGKHESIHVDFLSSALSAAGATPVEQCTYNFGVTSVETFLATAQILEGVGVDAYLGAAPSISSKEYLTAAGEILVIETRHNAWIRGAVFPEDSFPAPFETPLDPMEAYSLAAPFIVKCPSNNPALPFKPFPALTITGTGAPGATVKVKAVNATSTPKFLAFLGPLAPTFVEYSSSVKIPAGFYGQTYVVATSANQTTIDDSIIVAGPAIIEIPLSAKDYGITYPSISDKGAAPSSTAAAAASSSAAPASSSSEAASSSASASS